MPDQFSTKYPKGPHALDGRLLNAEHKLLNEVSYFASDGTNKQGETVLQPPPIYVGIFQVTNADNTCSYEDGEYQNPCSSKNLFTARQQVWNGDTQAWDEYDEDVGIDASCQAGLRQTLFKGEKFSGIFDRLRNMVVPMSIPGAYFLVLTAELAASDGVTATSATATIKIRNAASNTLEDATDADGAAITVTVYSWYSGSVANGTLIVAVRDGFGDLWLAAVDCP